MFDQDETPKETPSDAPAWEDLLKQVTREDGTQKYNSPEELVKGAIHAQNHIKTLEQERQALSERLKALEEGREKTAVEKALEKPNEPVPTVVGLTEQDVLALLSQVESKKQQDANVDAVRKAVIEAAGNEEAAARLFAERATAAGLDTGTLTALAAKSPEAAKRLLGITEKAPPQSKQVRSTITPSNLPKQEPERKRVMLGGVGTRDVVSEWNRHRPT